MNTPTLVVLHHKNMGLMNLYQANVQLVNLYEYNGASTTEATSQMNGPNSHFEGSEATSQEEICNQGQQHNPDASADQGYQSMCGGGSSPSGAPLEHSNSGAQFIKASAAAAAMVVVSMY